MNTPSPLRALCLRHLEALRDSTDNFRMAAVSSTDGFPIAVLNANPADTSSKTTAMAAALDGLSKTIAREFGLGQLEGTVLECEFGLFLCRQIHGPKRNLVLFLVMDEQVTYGHALWAVKNTARQMAATLQELVENPTA